MYNSRKLLSTNLAILTLLSNALAQSCPDYSKYATERHEPFSSGRYQLSYQRPTQACRTFNSSIIEDTIQRVTKDVIKDPDLARLFENTFPNTLDTAVRWRGRASDNADEELAFIITGDIDAMWLRDSTNQLLSYKLLLQASSDPNSLAALYRGVINLQARYLLTSPFCNSFQPPPESGIAPANNDASKSDQVYPSYDSKKVFECKYELDSLAAFLSLSDAYYVATKDADFFSRFKWVQAINAVLQVADSMQIGTYRADGSVAESAYSFQRETRRSTETFANDGLGSPVKNASRPSNMMFASYLTGAADIASKISGQSSLATRLSSLSKQVKSAIAELAVVPHPKFGKIYAFEVDGYGGAIIMDDGNIPSLLSAPYLGFLDRSDATYQNTRKLLLSSDNPYFMKGPVLSAVGSPHTGPGRGWPMGSIMRIITSDDDTEIFNTLKEIVASTDRLGLIHESIEAFDASRWSRQWFSWANGLFGEMILDLQNRKPGILQQCFQ